MKKAIKFLESHEGEAPSRFVEESTWRKENASWLRWSRQLAVTLIGYMQDNGMKRADLASKLGVSPQYVSKLLSGTDMEGNKIHNPAQYGLSLSWQTHCHTEKRRIETG